MTRHDTPMSPPSGPLCDRETRAAASESRCARPACPACGGALIEIRAKLQCAVCHVIVETCCEGGRG